MCICRVCIYVNILILEIITLTKEKNLKPVERGIFLILKNSHS